MDKYLCRPCNNCSKTIFKILARIPLLGSTSVFSIKKKYSRKPDLPWNGLTACSKKWFHSVVNIYCQHELVYMGRTKDFHCYLALCLWHSLGYLGIPLWCAEVRKPTKQVGWAQCLLLFLLLLFCKACNFNPKGFCVT